MKITNIPQQQRAPHALADVPLTPLNDAFLQDVLQTNAGAPAWRLRKAAEARSLVALAQLAPQRFKVLEMDLSGSLRMLFALRTPVPLRPDASGELRFDSEAVLGFDYPPQAVSNEMPGTGFVCALKPLDIWLGNVAQPRQFVCLGPKIAAGTRCRMLVMMTYAALAGQTIQEVDPRSGAGVMNLEAALWWQRNLNRLPFSAEPFLPEGLDGGGGAS